MKLRLFASHPYKYWDKLLGKREKAKREYKLVWINLDWNIKWQLGNSYKYGDINEEQYEELIKRVLMYNLVDVWGIMDAREMCEDKELFDKYYAYTPAPKIYANGKHISILKK
jgi:hypothetical protein